MIWNDMTFLMALGWVIYMLFEFGSSLLRNDICRANYSDYMAGRAHQMVVKSKESVPQNARNIHV